MKKRVMYIINSAEGGGAASPVPSIIKVMKDANLEVEILVLTPRNRKAISAFDKGGVIYNIREGGESDNYEAIRWVNQKVLLFKPDLIWTSLTRATIIGQIVGLYNKIPVVSWQHNAYLKPWNKRILRATQSLSKLWVADSNNVNKLTQERLKVSADRVMTWSIFASNPYAPQSQQWQPGQTINIASLGRLHEAKGYDVLISAIELMKNEGFRAPAPVIFNIGGEGSQRDHLIHLMRQKRISTINLCGFTNNTKEFLANNHLYIQPSRREGFCIAAHEAMQAGLPVIASNVGELTNTVTDDTGILVNPENPHELAKALVTCLSSPDRLHDTGLSARSRVLDLFSEEKFIENGMKALSAAGVL